MVDRKKEMNKGVQFYKERLGLEFERVDGKANAFLSLKYINYLWIASN